MKSLIMKDLFNINHNAKSMLSILLVFVVVLIPFSGVQTYIIVCAILCSMMIVTTFTFDTNSNWDRYAMVMPVSKKDIVAGKFIVLLIFSAIGAVFGLVVGTVGGIILKKITFNPGNLLELTFLALIALVIAVVYGGMSIPLVFRFGAEKGRMLLLISFVIPAAICFAVYQILLLLGIAVTEQLTIIIFSCSPVIALIWNYLMFKLSCSFYAKQEF